MDDSEDVVINKGSGEVEESNPTNEELKPQFEEDMTYEAMCHIRGEMGLTKLEFEAIVKERDADIAERDADIAERDAVIAEMKERLQAAGL